jgi:hypothetical protein
VGQTRSIVEVALRRGIGLGVRDSAAENVAAIPYYAEAAIPRT